MGLGLLSAWKAVTMKMSLEWHRNCLKNWKQNAERAVVAAERAKVDADRMAKEVAFYEKQIEAAEKAGKDGFDPERFMKAKFDANIG